MHVVFIEPRFPGNQKLFIKALAEIGAKVTAIGEGSKDSLDGELKRWLTHYEQVGSVCDEGAVLQAVRFIQGRAHVDRLEATVEAHIMPIAKVREAAGIPGTSVRTAFLCRDKPAMKEVLRKGGVPCAESTAASSTAEVTAFAERVGFPLILKPRDGAGASGATRVDSMAEIEAACHSLGLGHSAAESRGRSIAVEETSRATRASTTPSRSTAPLPTTSSATTTPTSSRRCAPGVSRRSSSPPTASTRRRATSSSRRWASGS